MSIRNTLTVIGTVLSLGVALPATAQTQPGTPQQGTQSNTGETTVSGERVQPGRLNNDRQPNRRQDRRPAAPPTPPTPEELKGLAQTVATAASSTCVVNEAVLLGVNAEQQQIYEAACATGPGYILINSVPPQAVDCVILAGQADLDRSRDPAADVGIQCKLPANTDVARVVSAYAREANIACTVDQAASIGKSPEGNFIYEVGCKDLDGYWLEKAPAGWEKTSCLQVVTQSAGCRFTTPVEQAATVKAMLAGSDAAGCDVIEARYMGGNANGTFYEAKCGGGDGYIARFNAQQVIQQVYPCAEASRIGGGCKLTTVAAAPETTPPTPEAN